MNESEQTPPVEEEKPFQFELRTLFLVMFLFAAFCGFVSGFLLEWALFYWSLCLLLTGMFLWCRRERRRLGKRMAVVGLVLALLFGISLPVVGSAREAIKGAGCVGRLKIIGLALHNYADVNNDFFPPAYVADKSGKPMHSWRVLILPLLDRQDIYDKYNFDEPWDGPNNSKLHDIVIPLFQCPFAQSNGKETDTSYVAVVGPGTMFPGGKPLQLSDMRDGSSRTILIVEVANSGIHWMEPRDLDITKITPTGEPLERLGISSNHPKVVGALFGDGSVQCFDKDKMTMEQLQALLSRDGGEEVDPDEF